MSADESITSLPDAVASQGALPVPVVPEPQALSPERLAEITARTGAATEGPWRVVEGHEIHQGAEFGDFAVFVAQTDPACGCVQSAADAEFIAHARTDVPELLTDNARLRARIAELEAKRHSTNEALDDAVQELRRRESGPALPWAHVMSDHDLHGFLDDLVSAALGRWRSEPEVPDRVVLADIEKVCADWRTPGVGSRLDGSEFDGVTVRLVEPEPDKHLKGRARLDASAAAAAEATHWKRLGIAEPAGEFDAFLHHENRLGHDLPETGGAS